MPVSYKEARADLLRTMRETKIASDSQVAQAEKDLPPVIDETAKTPPPCFTGFDDIAHDLTYAFRICRDPAGGWYSLLIVANNPVPTLP